MAGPEVSHGRGGAGNIKEDDTKYVDGEVVRAGVEGSHGDGAYSTGRGGAANIADKGTGPAPRKDADVVPPVATRPSQENADFHTGRGGAGNEHIAPEKAAKGPHQSLADKLKTKILGVFKK
jgi:hypothetical protein